MNDTILAAIISVGGALIAAFGASYLTIYLTDRKEKKRQELVFSNIRDVYQRVFIKEVNNEIDILTKMKKRLQDYIILKKEDREEEVDLDSYSVLNIFTQSDIMLFCMECKVSYYQLYEVLKQFELQKPKTSKMILTDFLSKIKQKEYEGANMYNVDGRYNKSFANFAIVKAINEIDESLKTLKTPVHNSKVLLQQMGIQ